MAELFPWQASLWCRLSTRQQHAHAYLFTGPAGIGKQALATRLMALLLCREPISGTPCGQCKSCRLLHAGTHPDCFVLEPEEVDKAIRVDQVRDLVEFVGRTAQLGGRKVVLLHPAEAMNLNAANALLKCLEEPSGDTHLLLVSHQPARLLPTIKSRCVQQACPLPGREQSLNWLTRHLPELSAEHCALLLRLAGHSPLTALRLHGEGAVELYAKVIEDLKKLHKQQAFPSQLAESWHAAPLLLLFDWFSLWTLQLMRYQMAGNEAALEPDEMDKVLTYLARKASVRRVAALQDWLLDQRQKVLAKSNLNRLLLLEALLVQWASLAGPG